MEIVAPVGLSFKVFTLIKSSITKSSIEKLASIIESKSAGTGDPESIYCLVSIFLVSSLASLILLT